MTSSPSAPPPQRSTPQRRRFDATWLPFGMMIGFILGMGIGLVVVDNLFLGALVGLAVGAGLGIALGRRGSVPDSAAEEDALDEEHRRAHGDHVAPRRPDSGR